MHERDGNPGGDGWRLGPRLRLHADRPSIIGILNVTPDSFADGGRYADASAAADAALVMHAAGALVIDVGGESTRPGAEAVPAAEQIARVVPVIGLIRRRAAVALTIDTTSPQVAAAALDAGADGINDISAGRDSAGETLALAARRDCGLVLMHRRSLPRDDRYSDRYAFEPGYADVVGDVLAFLTERARAAQAAGVRPENIAIDPGLGFGKSVEQNLALIRGTPRLAALGFPVMSALSRKSFVGRVSLARDSAPGERLAGTLALSALHLALGATLFRVHDVPEHAQALGAGLAALRARDSGIR